jgi:hypothetical protein
MEILVTGSQQQHSKKRAPPPTTEFANLGFCDDLAAEEEEDGVHNLSMDALKPSNSTNYAAGSHTLPRAGGGKKHKQARNIEPFSVSKSSSMYK